MGMLSVVFRKVASFIHFRSHIRHALTTSILIRKNKRTFELINLRLQYFLISFDIFKFH